MAPRRVRVPVLGEYLFRLIVVLLVGMYYDHQKMAPGTIVVAAIGLIIGPSILQRKQQPTEQAEQLYPETEVALRLGPLVREHGPEVIHEVEEAVRRRALPRGRDHVGGK